MNKYQTSIASSLALILFGTVIWIAVPYCIRQANMYSMGVTWLDSYFVPRFLVGLLMVSSLANIAMCWVQIRLMKKKRKKIPDNQAVSWSDELRVIAMMLIFIAYCVLLKYTGFIISSSVAVFASLTLMKSLKIWHYVVGFIFVVAVYLIFRNVLYVMLP